MGNTSLVKTVKLSSLTVEELAGALKEKIAIFCDKYDLQSNQKNYLKDIYSKGKTKNATKLTHSILANLYRTLQTATIKKECLKEIIETFPNISSSTAYRLYKGTTFIVDEVILSTKRLTNDKRRLSAPL